MRGDSDGSRRTERAARQVISLSLCRVASLGLLIPQQTGEEVIAIMDTQITNKGSLTNNFWVQIGALVILTVVVIALAAKYIWS
jgi:hypothetical protein